MFCFILIQICFDNCLFIINVFDVDDGDNGEGGDEDYDDDDGEYENDRGPPPGGPAERGAGGERGRADGRGDQLSEAEGPDDLPARGREHPLPVLPQVGPAHSSSTAHSSGRPSPTPLSRLRPLLR